MNKMNKMAYLFWKGYYLNVLRNSGLIDDEEYAYLNATVGKDLDKNPADEGNHCPETDSCAAADKKTGE